MTELTNLADVKAALLLGPVFCDIAQPYALRLPVRNVRAFKREGADQTSGLTNNEWTSIQFQGRAKGFEVLVLEGWHVPERVYREKRP